MIDDQALRKTDALEGRIVVRNRCVCRYRPGHEALVALCALSTPRFRQSHRSMGIDQTEAEPVTDSQAATIPIPGPVRLPLAVKSRH